MTKVTIDDDWLTKHLAEPSIEDDGFTQQVMHNVDEVTVIQWFTPACTALSIAFFAVFVYLLAGVDNVTQQFSVIQQQETNAIFAVMLVTALVWLIEKLDVFE